MTMPGAEALLTFAAASLVTMVIPGPAVVYVVTRSIAHGRVAGLYSMAGLETGAAVHVLLSVAGVAALLHTFPVALSLLTWTGAGYLLWLAVRELLATRAGLVDGAALAPPVRRRLYFDGLLVDLLNPKTALFFLAFLPQFVDTSRGSISAQLAVLGTIFVLIGGLCDGVYAMLASRLSQRLRASTTARRRLAAATAGVYLTLAVAALAL